MPRFHYPGFDQLQISQHFQCALGDPQMWGATACIVLCHFIEGTRAFENFGIHGGPRNSPLQMQRDD